jgi:ADP-ribose pyrophosphatase
VSDIFEHNGTVLESTSIFSGRIINVRVDKVALPNGYVSTREIVEHSEAVAIVPLDENGNVLLVRQYRLACEEALLEVPAGGMDHGDEEPLAAAQRELQEEIGYKAERMEYLSGFYVAPGYCNEYIHLFLATGLTPSRLDADLDEAVEVVRIPLDEALGLIATGEIHDAKSIIGLLMAQRKSS